MKVGAVDLTILVAYLLGVLLWGLWIGRGSRTVSDYMLGGRHLPWWLILFSIVATETYLRQDPKTLCLSCHAL